VEVQVLSRAPGFDSKYYRENGSRIYSVMPFSLVLPLLFWVPATSGCNCRCYTEAMITKAALLLFRDTQGKKELLFARAKGRSYYIFPGGKQEADETIEEALQRELQEELGTTAANVKKLGVVSGHTPDGREMEMHLYSGELQEEPKPQAEIQEIVRMTRDAVAAKQELMTPMTLDHVLPFLKAQNIW
jgi:8-oxo-dGTP diphosphatase